MRAHVDELRASRARIVTAGYAERRRLERDLHAEAAARLDESLEELNEATAERRELARGLHPAALELSANGNGTTLRARIPCG